MKTLMAIAICILATTTAMDAYAQRATLHGKVVDEETGQPLIGASVLLVGTSMGASTNLDGEYTVTEIPPGTYDVRFSFLGYERKVIPGYMVKADDSLELNVGVRPLRADASPEAFTIEDLRVTAERVLSTDAAVLVDRLRAGTVSDAISAEQISKSPDATSSDALKRVTGLSVVDDKYVFIRGVTDRYNATTLNGITVTSTDTDADKKSFAFDIVPAPLLSNTIVTKTVAPDLPGDFSGGLVQMNTLDFPTERIITVTAGGTSVKGTSKHGILLGQGGTKDKWGTDDGSRAMPAGDLQGNALAQALPNTWTTNNTEAPYNGKYSIALGDRFTPGSQEIGFVGAFTYKSSYDSGEFLEEPKKDGLPIYVFQGTTYGNNVLWGGLLDVNYKPHPNHVFSIGNTYNQSGSQVVAISEGENQSGGYQKRQSIEWDERTFWVGKAGAVHTFDFLHGLTVDWNLNGTRSEASEPDRKYLAYHRSPSRPDLFLLGENYRTWSDLEEKGQGFAIDVTFPVNEFARVKAGYLRNKRVRDYAVESWSTDSSKLLGQDKWLLTYAPDSIFAAKNYGPTLFQFIPQSVFTGEYSGELRLDATYGMVDFPFGVLGQRFRLLGGVRIEDAVQTVNTIEATDVGNVVVSKIDEKDVLPSVNFTYILNRKTNLRLAYSESVNRPEFREMSDVLYLDLNTFQNVIGNPNLERAEIRNYDARIELFPDIGQVIAFSYFHKAFTNPIETQLLPAPDRFVRTWFNSPEGKNTGYELELRKSLGFLGAPLGFYYLNNFMVTFNYTKVESEIQYTEGKTDTLGNQIFTDKTRPMQGQAPWMMNAGILFVEPHIGLTMNLLYNRIGRRLSAVGDDRDQDVYEEERNILDFALTQNLFYGASLKFTIKDWLANDVVYTSTKDQSVHSQYEAATQYGLSIAYTF